MIRRPFLLAALAATSLAHAAAPKQAVPYWASIGAKAARMRTGPARAYPATWLYRRQGLPVRVIAVFKEWRKVADPDGAEGWMQDNLLSSQRTAIIRAGQPIAMRKLPTGDASLLWHAAPGVVGRISACGNGWCRFDVKGQAGFVEVGGIWGVEGGEVVP